MALAVVVRQ